MTTIQDMFRYKTKVSHKYMVVTYHRNTPLPKGPDGSHVLSVAMAMPQPENQ
jgi:hypothetical protein